MKRWPLYTIAAVSLILIPVRMIWPLLRIDNTSLILLGIATVALLVALLPIKKIKWGEFEAELDRKLDALNIRVEATENIEESAIKARRQIIEIDEADPTYGTGILPPGKLSTETQKLYDGYVSILKSSSSDVEKIVAAMVFVEKAIADACAKANLGIRSRNPRYGIAELTKHGVLTEEDKRAFDDVWSLRNRIVHEGRLPTPEQTARFLDIVWRLIEKLA
jgi:uncharacterized protein YutE (UPF0331/DUF86 family)